MSLMSWYSKGDGCLSKKKKTIIIKQTKNHKSCAGGEKCCFCWRGSVRYRRWQTRAPSLNDFWLWRILWVLVFLHVAVADVHYHTGSGFRSCVQLVFLSWKQRKNRSKANSLSSSTDRGTFRFLPPRRADVRVLLLPVGEGRHG